jgi:glycerol-3-phosphate dehydrogenase
VRCEPEERDYILSAVHRIFPNIPLDAAQIVFSYSGIRPLPKSDHAFTGRISRGHFIQRLDGKVPLFCMVGGKWTTFRAFAEQTADAVLDELKHPRRTDTRHRPIGGGLDFPADPATLEADLCRRFGIDRNRAAHLVSTYGTASIPLLTFCRARPDDAPLAAGLPWTEAEIVWLIETEDVVHLADIVLRRTTLAISGAIDGSILDRLGALAARSLGWSTARTEAEKAALIAELDRFHDVSAARLAARTHERTHACA